MSAGILILAAGHSRRMGSDKRRLPWNDGHLLEHAIKFCKDTGLPYIVALSCREEDDALAELCDQNCVRIKESDLGLGHTLAHAIGALPSSWSAVIVHLADMPLVKSSTFQLIADQLQRHPIVIPSYHGQWGNPRGFARQLWPQLTLLTGDQGAKDVIKSHSDVCYVIDVDDDGILIDIDTRADYEAVLG
jgi:molybdenum cofactor cytidylyltransferase